MTDADKPAFAATLAELSLLRPALKLTEQHYTAWWNVMRYDWTIAEFQAAARQLAQHCDDISIGPQHFAKLRRTASTEAAAEAWPLVVRALQTGRQDGISERAQRVVRAMGGWRHLAMQPTETRHFRERRFLELWEELGSTDEARQLLPHLAPRIAGPASFAQLTHTEQP